MLYLSRSFVEFGPFSVTEMLGFHQRGILADSDYVRADGTENWLHVNDWAANQMPIAEPKPVKKPAAAKAKAAEAPAAAPVVKKPATKRTGKAA